MNSQTDDQFIKPEKYKRPSSVIERRQNQRLSTSNSSGMARRSLSNMKSAYNSSSTALPTNSVAITSTSITSTKSTSPTFSNTSSASSSITPQPEMAFPAIGDLVIVPALQQRGYLRYVGPIEGKLGVWAGVELETLGAGKNDGSVNGVYYFICPTNTGIFIPATKILVANNLEDDYQQNPPRRSSSLHNSSIQGTLIEHKLRRSRPSSITSNDSNSRISAISTANKEPTRSLIGQGRILPRRFTQTNVNSNIPSVSPTSMRGYDDAEHDNISVKELLETISSLNRELEEYRSSQQEDLEKIELKKEIASLQNHIEELKFAGKEAIDLYEETVKLHDKETSGLRKLLNSKETEIDRLRIESSSPSSNAQNKDLAEDLHLKEEYEKILFDYTELKKQTEVNDKWIIELEETLKVCEENLSKKESFIAKLHKEIEDEKEAKRKAISQLEKLENDSISERNQKEKIIDRLSSDLSKIQEKFQKIQPSSLAVLNNEELETGKIISSDEWDEFTTHLEKIENCLEKSEAVDLLKPILTFFNRRIINLETSMEAFESSCEDLLKVQGSKIMTLQNEIQVLHEKLSRCTCPSGANKSGCTQIHAIINNNLSNGFFPLSKKEEISHVPKPTGNPSEDGDGIALKLAYNVRYYDQVLKEMGLEIEMLQTNTHSFPKLTKEQVENIQKNMSKKLSSIKSALDFDSEELVAEVTRLRGKIGHKQILDDITFLEQLQTNITSLENQLSSVGKSNLIQENPLQSHLFNEVTKHSSNQRSLQDITKQTLSSSAGKCMNSPPIPDITNEESEVTPTPAKIMNFLKFTPSNSRETLVEEDAAESPCQEIPLSYDNCSNLYCINCDKYGNHCVNECPLENEVF